VTDIDDTEMPLAQHIQEWGAGPAGEAVIRLVRVIRRHELELEQARTVILNLRERVKALEDAP
jgi:hypothetical protein